MKRKRQPDKLTTSELLAAGHQELAEHLRNRLSLSIANRRQRQKFTPAKGRGFIPTPLTS